MIIVTGAAGFIGSCLIKKLNQHNFNAIIAVDHFGDPKKAKNLEGAKVQEYVERDQFMSWLDNKGRMASVIWHAFSQISATGKMKLFRSHDPNYTDGGQMRDFVYVKDVIEVCYFLMHHRKNSGIYNLGSGKARTFSDLTKATFKAMGKPENIEFIDTPIDIRDKYQYFTEAKMEKLKSIGYDKKFTSLEEGVEDYVKNYLMTGLRNY
jgi:nucleoside-diphosphate-sugar epimerase